MLHDFSITNQLPIDTGRIAAKILVNSTVLSSDPDSRTIYLYPAVPNEVVVLDVEWSMVSILTDMSMNVRHVSKGEYD